MSKAVSIISIILGVILLAGMAFGVYVLLESTDYFRYLPKSFWVTVDGCRYFVDHDELVLLDSNVEVHYLVEWLSRKQGYTYKIFPAGNDFGYMVDGAVGNWLGIEDLTPAFEVVEQDKGFTVKCKGKTIADVLQALYPGRKITAPKSEDESFHFKLVVTSVDGKSVALTFRCSVSVNDIELDPPAIVF